MQFLSTSLFFVPLEIKEEKETKTKDISSMNNLLIIDEHHWAVMVNHVPPSIMELEHIGDQKWTTVHVQVCFHRDPSHVS